MRTSRDHKVKPEKRKKEKKREREREKDRKSGGKDRYVLTFTRKATMGRKR